MGFYIYSLIFRLKKGVNCWLFGFFCNFSFNIVLEDLFIFKEEDFTALFILICVKELDVYNDGFSFILVIKIINKLTYESQTNKLFNYSNHS